MALEVGRARIADGHMAGRPGGSLERPLRLSERPAKTRAVWGTRAPSETRFEDKDAGGRRDVCIVCIVCIVCMCAGQGLAQANAADGLGRLRFARWGSASSGHATSHGPNEGPVRRASAVVVAFNFCGRALQTLVLLCPLRCHCFRRSPSLLEPHSPSGMRSHQHCHA